MGTSRTVRTPIRALAVHVAGRIGLTPLPRALTPVVTNGEDIHPPQDLVMSQIHLDAVRTVPGMVVSAAPQGPAQILPAGVPSRVPRRLHRITPHKTERVGTHPHSGGTAPHRLTILRIEPLKALGQTNLAQVGCPLGSARLGQIGTRLRTGHDLPIEGKVCLLGRGQPSYCSVIVIQAAGEQHCGSDQHTGPQEAPSVSAHGMLLFRGITLGIASTPPVTCPATRETSTRLPA